MEYITLNNGKKIPILGFGVYQIDSDDCEACVLNALKVGYRLIDTAQVYFNEKAVGRAIKASRIPREEIFLTTKVWTPEFGYQNAYEECRKSVIVSMEKLQVDYLDLVLVHAPLGDYYAAWRALEDLHKEGKIHSLGISNFLPDRVADLDNFVKVKPVINQIETNPIFQRINDEKWMKKYHVQIESWAPFCEGQKNIFHNPILEQIAKHHQKSVAQVILRWLIQRQIVAIPKSVHVERMKENFDVFDFVLSDTEMNEIRKIDENKSCFMEPELAQVTEHLLSYTKHFHGHE